MALVIDMPSQFRLRGKMDHVGTAPRSMWGQPPSAVRRPRCIGPQAFVFRIVIPAEQLAKREPTSAVEELKPGRYGPEHRISV
jgi:hypothetical protein